MSTNKNIVYKYSLQMYMYISGVLLKVETNIHVGFWL